MLEWSVEAKIIQNKKTFVIRIQSADNILRGFNAESLCQ